MHRQDKDSILGELLSYRAQEQPNQTAYIFLKDGEIESHSITYQTLEQQAKAIASELNSLNIYGARALLIYPYDAGLEFIAAFFGCLYAGVVAVPSHPPRHRQDFSDLQARLTSSQAKVILTHKTLLAKLKRQLSPENVSSLFWLATDEIPTSQASTWMKPAELRSDTLACLQYTSGSTGIPKGVMLTHECILHNQQMLKLAFGSTEKTISVGWLPLFHDMGLVGNVIQSLYLGIPSILMSPLAFIQKPVRWLQAISHYRATTSGGPNFAYDLLCRQVTPQQKENLDLSSWELAFCGAEPIRPETIEQFSRDFAECGFRRESFYPCFGMAEATLFIAGGLKSAPPVIKYIEETALEKNKVVIKSSEQGRVRSLIGCGQSWLDEKIVIVDPNTLIQCPAYQVGEIWVSSASVGKGYWNLPEETARTFQAYLKDTGEGPFLRTGDLGFIDEGELFITGRLKDAMIFWGFKYYPQLIEQTVEKCHRALRPHSGAAFSIKVAGEEKLVIAQEVERSYRQNLSVEEVVEAIRWALFEQHLIDVYAIVLLKAGSIPKTTSGKIQRQACKAKFLDRSLDILDEWQTQEIPSDLTALLQRYWSPITHLRRYYLLTRGRSQRLLSQWLKS